MNWNWVQNACTGEFCIIALTFGFRLLPCFENVVKVLDYFKCVKYKLCHFVGAK